jgi:hypothetical protein
VPTVLSRAEVQALLAEDFSKGHGAVYLPFALADKYPNANREWIWQYVFPSQSLSPDEQDSVIRRFHVSETGLQKAVKAAVQKASIPKKWAGIPFVTALPPTCSKQAMTSALCRNFSGIRMLKRR